MKTQNIEFHSCYDELLSKLILMTYELLENNNRAIDNQNGTIVSLVSDEVIQPQRIVEHNSFCFLEHNFYKNTVRMYNNIYDLTAQEMIIYSLLLHKCIDNQNEEQTISLVLV